MALSTARALAAAIRQRRISSRELLGIYLDRVDTIGAPINAVITLDADRAGDQAVAADEATIHGGDLGPLHGLPITVKDAIEVGGIRSTGGARALAHHVPAADAPAVGRLRRAGAIVFGKTNVPEWSGDIQTFNELFGTTNNPWDLARTPGGSSGGAAAATASGLTSFELGTDIGGSVRIPASYCGVFGHKPTYGVVPQRGYLDRIGGGVIDPDINVFGPIARSASDLDLLLGILAGPNDDDAVGWSLSLPGPRHAALADYRIGTWLDDPFCPVDSESLALLSKAADLLAGAGCRVSAARPPIDLSTAARLFTSLLLAAVSVTVEGDRGHAVGGSHRAWLDLHQARTFVRRVWSSWFREFDVLLCPVMPMPPFPHDHHGTIGDRSVTINGDPRILADTLAWTGAIGVAYLPSTVVPVGRTLTGLPVGMQVVGPYLEDRTALFVASNLAELTGGYTPPPSAYSSG